MGDTGNVVLPTHESPEDLANDFSEFFLEQNCHNLEQHQCEQFLDYRRHTHG